MSLFKKLISSITGYLVLYAEVTQEIGRIAADFFKSRWIRFRSLPFSERIFAALTGFIIIFTFLPWRSYRIQFGEDATRRHGIYSDDFSIILLGCLLATVCLLRLMLPAEAGKLRRGTLYRYLGLAVVGVFSAWNWINPSRIALTTEATFAWSFYAFQALTVFWIITGVLGARYYAQYPERN